MADRDGPMVRPWVPLRMPLWLAGDRTAAVSARAGGLGWLTACERERLSRFAVPRRAAQFIAGRWLARELLARRYGGMPEDWRLEGEQGEPPRLAPEIAAHRSLHPLPHLSVSHAGEHIACALADGPVGIDIEPCASGRDRTGLLQAIATEEEREASRAALNGMADGPLALHLWALKEAWIKCTGAELFGTMLGLRVVAAPSAPSHANSLTWQRDGMVAAVMLQGPMPALAELATLGIDTVCLPRYWHLHSSS